MELMERWSGTDNTVALYYYAPAEQWEVAFRFPSICMEDAKGVLTELVTDEGKWIHKEGISAFVILDVVTLATCRVSVNVDMIVSVL